MFKTKLRPVRNTNRQALAEAIGHAAAAERVAEAARTAVARASEILAAATARQETAAGEVARARNDASARASSAATTGNALAPDGALREARIAEQDAGDEVDAARAALVTVETTLDDAEYQLEQARKGVAAAVKPVMATEADRLMAEIGNLEAQAFAKRAALTFLFGNALDWPPTDQSRRIQTVLTTAVYPRSPVDHPAVAAWRAARDALSGNADAVLPE